MRGWFFKKYFFCCITTVETFLKPLASRLSFESHDRPRKFFFTRNNSFYRTSYNATALILGDPEAGSWRRKKRTWQNLKRRTVSRAAERVLFARGFLKLRHYGFTWSRISELPLGLRRRTTSSICVNVNLKGTVFLYTEHKLDNNPKSIT